MSQQGPPFMRASLRVLVSTAMLSAILAGCAVPPTTGFPTCPNRQSVVLEQADPSAYSVIRGVSGNGAWVIVSRVIGTDFQFFIRTATGDSTPMFVGALPTSLFTWAPPYAAVSSDGQMALFGERNEKLMRWTASSGTATEVVPPVVASPPPGVASPAEFRELSSDGTRAMWHQSFFVAPSSWNFVTTITDTATDAVASQEEVEYFSSPFQFSSGGRFITTQDELVEVDTSTATPFDDARLQLTTDFGVGDYWPLDSSDNGRFTVFWRNFGGSPSVQAYYLWDSANSTTAEIASGSDLYWTAGIANDGRLLYLRNDGVTTTVLERDADGSQGVGQSSPILETWGTLDPYRPVKQDRVAASSNLKTVAFSEVVPLLGNQLTARRCT